MVVRRQFGEQRAQHRRRVAQQRTGGTAEAIDLLGIDVEPHDRQRVVHTPHALLPVEPRADRQHRIGVLPQRVALGERHRERMRRRDDATPAAERRHRRGQRLGDRLDLGAGIQRAAADHDQRTLRLAQDRCRACHRIGIDRRHHGCGDVGKLHRAGHAPGVDRAFQRHRPRPAAACDAHRLRHQCRRLVRRTDACRVLGDVAQQPELVVDLVQMPVPVVDRERRNLPGQRDHRRAHAIGGEQCRRGVQHTRSRHHGERLRPAGHQRGAESHVGGGLLVPRMQHAEPALLAMGGIEQVVVVHAGQRVEGIDAVADQALDHRIGGAHVRHWLCLPLPQAGAATG